jgi:DMSO/TMAO reductase YedYZ molybdopterin-dependent catalytic subunit
MAASRALGDHRVVSPSPLIVECDLSTSAGPYTPVEDFYVRNHGEVPKDAGESMLRIEGDVAHPQALRMQDLAGLPKRKMAAVLECAGNPVRTSALVSNGLWEGRALADVLSRAEPLPSGKFVHFRGRDGYARSVLLERVMARGILATHLNGRPLRRTHGMPWRALFPGWYGMDAVKWLESISLSPTELESNHTAYIEITRPTPGKVEQRPLGPMLVKSVICAPEDGAVLVTPRTTIRGLGWSGSGKLARVELSTDGGENWRPAAIEGGADYGWSLWQLEMELKRGAVELVCRATDEKGNQQVPNRDPGRLDGYENSWYHRVRCVIV